MCILHKKIKIGVAYLRKDMYNYAKEYKGKQI